MPAGLQSSLAESFKACCAAEYKQKGHAEKALKDGSRILNLAQAHFPGEVSAAMQKAFLQALEREASGSKSQATAKRLLEALSPGTEAGPKKRKSTEDGGPKRSAKTKKII